MINTKKALIAVFLGFSLAADIPAAELNTLSLADVRELSAEITAPIPQPAFDEAFSPNNGKDPVVITIAGLKFGEIGWGSMELRNFLRLIQMFSGNKEITEADIVGGVVSFNPRYFFPSEEDAPEPAENKTRLADNFLEVKLKEIPGYQNHNVILIPFAWSRDPGDSRIAVKELQTRITGVYDTFKDSGRPIYILAHSWGSVLAHTALHRVAEIRPDVKIAKFITAGSPLVPSNYVVRLFMKMEIRKEGLEKTVRKPSIVGSWRNFWAMRDVFSNEIPAADYNFRADAEVENVEPTLINLILHNKLLKKEARKDLFKIRDTKAWHAAYFFDYQASLKSINKEIYVPIFMPAMAPQVVDCAKNPGNLMCAF